MEIPPGNLHLGPTANSPLIVLFDLFHLCLPPLCSEDVFGLVSASLNSALSPNPPVKVRRLRGVFIAEGKSGFRVALFEATVVLKKSTTPWVLLFGQIYAHLQR